MVWGDLLSVLQLAAGLNTAYFSFSELRQPIVASERRALAEVKRAIDERSQIERSSDHYTSERLEHLQLGIDLDTIHLRYQTIDKLSGRLCLATSVAYIALLVTASCFASSPISCPVFAIVISIVGYLPIMLSFIISVAAMQQVSKKVSKRRQRLELAVLSAGSAPSLQTRESPSLQGDSSQ